MKVILNYISEVRSELGKVVWPTREETIRLTILVLAVSVLVAAYVGGLDFVLTRVLTFVLVR